MDGVGPGAPPIIFGWAGDGARRSDSMQFEERDVGDYRIFVGALEGPQGDGYIAAMVVQRVQGVPGAPREAYRDESLACGHRWQSAEAALAYAIGKAQDAIRERSPMLAC